MSPVFPEQRAAAEERQAVVAFLRSRAARSSASTGFVLEVLALSIENGDHLR